MAVASGRLRQSTDFKRQRERRAKAEARVQAAAGVQCSYFSKYGRCCRAGGECLPTRTFTRARTRTRTFTFTFTRSRTLTRRVPLRARPG